MQYRHVRSWRVSEILGHALRISKMREKEAVEAETEAPSITPSTDATDSSTVSNQGIIGLSRVAFVESNMTATTLRCRTYWCSSMILFVCDEAHADSV